MKQNVQDKVEGKGRELKGKVQKAAGKIADRPDLEKRGRRNEAAGKIQKKVGDIEKVFEV